MSEKIIEGGSGQAKAHGQTEVTWQMVCYAVFQVGSYCFSFEVDAVLTRLSRAGGGWRRTITGNTTVPILRYFL